MQLLLSYKVFRWQWHPLNIMLQLLQLLNQYSKLSSQLPLYSIQLANSWPSRYIKALVACICSYSQITAASDWSHLFTPQVFLFSIPLLFVKRVIHQWFCSSSSDIHHHKGHESNNDYFQQLAVPQYIFSIQFHLHYTLVYMQHFHTSDQREFLWFKCDASQPQFSRCVTTSLVCYNFPVECGVIFQWNAYNYATTSTGML